MKQLTKANGFPTLYGYACGYGREYTTRTGAYITLQPFCNGLEVKGNGQWDQFYYWDYTSPSMAAKAAEKEFIRRCEVA